MELNRLPGHTKPPCAACAVGGDVAHFDWNPSWGQESFGITEIPRPVAQAIDQTFENEFRMQ